ncbi:hypothetical protein I3843_11G094200 [Carya illinoinensis]|nr:hypothetical protein I3843_11G094200 [Carya illinoinensis]
MNGLGLLASCAAMFMFLQMFPEAVRPLNFTFSNVLIVCSRISALEEGMPIRGVAINVGFGDDLLVSSYVIDIGIT